MFSHPASNCQGVSKNSLNLVIKPTLTHFNKKVPVHWANKKDNALKTGLFRGSVKP